MHEGEELAARISTCCPTALAKLGRPDEGDKALDHVEGYVSEHKDRGIYLSFLQYRGMVRLLSNRFEEAAPFFQRVVDRARKAQIDPQTVTGVINLAWCEYRLGRLDRAADLYTETLPLTTPDYRHLYLGHLANIFRDRHEYAKAAEYYRLAAGLARGRNREYYSIWPSNLAGTLCDEVDYFGGSPSRSIRKRAK